jgi:hypothetical protein
MSEDRITSTVAQFIKRSGMGKTKVYELINRGDLETAKIDNTRLVLEESYRRLLNRSRVPPERHVRRGGGPL